MCTASCPSFGGQLERGKTTVQPPALTATWTYIWAIPKKEKKVLLAHCNRLAWSLLFEVQVWQQNKNSDQPGGTRYFLVCTLFLRQPLIEDYSECAFRVTLKRNTVAFLQCCFNRHSTVKPQPPTFDCGAYPNTSWTNTAPYAKTGMSAAAAVLSLYASQKLLISTWAHSLENGLYHHYNIPLYTWQLNDSVKGSFFPRRSHVSGW